MKDKAGGATERARGDRFGTNGAPETKRRRAAGMQGREKVLAIEPSVCYTLFDAKYERKELLKCTFCTTTR